MSSVDKMLDGDELIVQQISSNEGPMAAKRYVQQFNNACMQMCGFEDALEEIEHRFKATGIGFFASVHSLSYTTH